MRVAKPRHFFGAFLMVLVVASLLLPHGTSDAASGFGFDTQVVYRIDGTTTQVTENYTVTNQTTRQFLTAVKLSTPVEVISGLAASYQDGTVIPITVTPQTTMVAGVSYRYQNLTLSFPRQIYGQGRSWSFSVHYQTQGLVESHGGAHTVYVPSIKSDTSRDSYTVQVNAPLGYGRPHFQGTKTDSVTVGAGRQVFNFSKSQLTGSALSLNFGDESSYRINFNFPLNNDGPVSQVMTVTLPPNLNNQTVHIESLDPMPMATRLDADGNILADYRVAAGQHLVVKTVVSGTVRYLDYNLAASGYAKDIPAALVRQYTGSSKYWTTNGAVAAQTKTLINPSAPVIDNVKVLYQYVIDHLTYNPNKIKFNVRQGSAAALANPTNVVCLEYSDLLIAMLRSQGIPARMPVGYGYTGSLKQSASVSDSLHSWVEAYVPGIGWMTLDPTWGEKFDLFGQSDLDHFAFAVWGTHDQLPAPTMAQGHDLGYQYEQAQLSYAPAATAEISAATISQHRFWLLPGLSLAHVNLANQGNSVLVATLTSAGRSEGLARLAPGQHQSRWRLIIGRYWDATGSASLSQGGGVMLAAASITYSRWPMVVVVLGAVGLALALVLRLRRFNRPDL